MAALKGPHTTPGGVSAVLPGAAAPARTGGTGSADPRAVRVSLAPASAAVGLEPMTVAPPDLAEAEAGPRRDAPALRHLDADRAVLSRAGEPDARLLLLPPLAAGDRGPVRREGVVAGWRFEVEVEPAARAALRERAHRGRADRGHSGPTEVRAIIPGVVVSVSVTAGDEVVAGQQLLAVEAMKMQNELRAPRDGVIERVAIGTGQTIEVGDLLLVIS